MKKHIQVILIILICLIFWPINKITALNNIKYNVQYEEIVKKNFVELFRGNEVFNSDKFEVTQTEKEKNNLTVALFGVGLIIYWIILLVVFEKEKVTEYKIDDKIDDREIFEKYNPMLAGALAQNRQVLPRDLTAIILNLIHKKVINMKMIPSRKGKEQYIYMISENKQEIYKLEETERYVMNWLFSFYEKEEIDLIEKMKEISRSKDFSNHIKKLNSITQK